MNKLLTIIPIVITNEIDVIPALLTVWRGDGIGKEPSVKYTHHKHTRHTPKQISKSTYFIREEKGYTAYG